MGVHKNSESAPLYGSKKPSKRNESAVSSAEKCRTLCANKNRIHRGYNRKSEAMPEIKRLPGTCKFRVSQFEKSSDKPFRLARQGSPRGVAPHVSLPR
ncbi:hypothetical protein CEXT_150961 [Caerostris extrusa]|uniref:Uncharacterized protein n=1 Tax=Caerostris extrusa TaxID=172846 RepID=A0AAV4NN69_CAEEX|nr:hypothetical protein CEXT_150961 [Caerostris extrusa]